MLYTINNTIKFRTCDGVIWVNDNPDSEVILTTTACRLLHCLLSRHNDIIERDDILNVVWDTHGLRASNNSLNKYISDLRQLFRNLGERDDIIITVPKIGFKISSSAVVEMEKIIIPSHDMSAKPITKKKSELPRSIPHIKDNFTKLNHWFPEIITATLLFFGTVFILQSNLINDEQKVKDKKFYYITDIGSCKINSLNYINEDKYSISLAIVKDILKSEKLICPKDGKIFFQLSDSVLYGNVGKTFIALCQNMQAPKKNLSSCYSYYEKSYAHQKEKNINDLFINTHDSNRHG